VTHSAFISRNCIMCPAWPFATAGEPHSRADYNGLPIANAKRSKNDANDAAVTYPWSLSDRGPIHVRPTA
jgi:hypothetical protein